MFCIGVADSRFTCFVLVFMIVYVCFVLMLIICVHVCLFS